MKAGKKLLPVQVLALGLLIIIFIGGILLSSPLCNRSGSFTPFIDGLFTSTSATCVTGLIVNDTFTQFNFFGQLIILVLIQIGGLGFMGIVMTIPILIGKKLSIIQSTLLMESVGILRRSKVSSTIRRMLIGTALFEGIGAVVLAAVFIPKVGILPGIWYGIFHSVSAFCNAGFDLMGRFEKFSSLTLFYDNPVVLITIMLLIISGGIGFIVWNDIADYKFKIKKYSLHSKIMLLFTGVIIFAGALLFFFTEGQSSFAGMNFGDKIVNSFFASVSPRTAGFNSVSFDEMTSAGRFITMLLMFIGAGSGSTGGGIKITTIVALMLSIDAYSRNYNDLSIFKRRLTAGTQKKSMAIISAYMLIVLTCNFFLLIFNPQLPGEECLFEALSAMGTVGLTMGITTSLGLASKLVLMITMYMGRLGSLALAMAIVRRKVIPKIHFPEENIVVG